MTRHVIRRAAAAVALAGLLTGMLMVLVGWRAQRLVPQHPDPYGFAEMAREVAAGRGFAGHGTLLRRRAPLYPLFVAGVYAIGGGRDLPVKVAQALLFGATCLLAFDIGRRVFGVRAGVAAGLLCATHPVLLRYVPDFHLETLLTFLMTLAVWTGLRLLERPGMGRAALFGAVCGLTALTKAVALGFPIAFAAWWLITARRGARPWGLAAAALACMALTIAPWTARNWVATGGRFVPISTGLSDAYLRGIVFTRAPYALLRLPPYTYAENDSNAMLKAVCAREGAVWQADDYETDRILNREAARRVRERPGELARKTAVGLLTFWYQLTSLPNSLIAGAWAVLGWALALTALRRARRPEGGPPAWPVWLAILALNLSLAPLLALGRYSAPVLPALMVLAGAGIDALLRRTGNPEPVPDVSSE